MQNTSFQSFTLRDSGVFQLAILAALFASCTCRLTADGARPSRPLGLTLTAKSAAAVSLAWTALTGAVDVVAYDVYRDDQPVGVATSNSFICSGLTAEQSYTFRVRARDRAGNLSDPSNALLTTPQAAGLQAPPILVRTQFYALVLNYEPWIYADGSYMRAAEHYGLRDVGALVAQYVELFRKASGGQMNWKVVQRFDLNEWAPPDGNPSPLYNATNCVELMEQGYEYRASYTSILHDPRFNIIDRVNQEQLDAIWVFGPPGVGFWETAMVGPSPFWVNGAETFDSALTRNIVFYGFGKEGHQGVGFMCENTCHMTECIVRDRIAPSWPLTVAPPVFNTLNLDNPSRTLAIKPVNDWTHFTQAGGISWDPVLVAPGNAQAGLSHFPPTALFNYDWNTLFLDFNNLGPFQVYDGSWSGDNGELHVQSGDGVKVLALDGMELGDELGKYHPAEAFFDGDVEFTVRVADGSKPSHAGFLFRVWTCASGANQVRGYYLGIDVFYHRLVLARLDNSFNLLTNVLCSELIANKTCAVRLELRGPRIAAYLNNSLDPALSFVDSAYGTGGFGFAAYDTEAWFDNLSVVTHVVSTADKWYGYPNPQSNARDLTPLEWDGDRDIHMDGFYAWWWEHVPKNGGGHYATNLVNGSRSLMLNTWWPYIFDHNRFSSTRPFPDIAFPPEDVTPPSAPLDLLAMPLSGSKVGLAWTEPHDNVGVTRYRILRDGVFLRKTTLPYLVDTRLRPGTSHHYVVQACDGSGNISPGTSVEVTTMASEAPGSIIDGGFEFNPQVAGWQEDAFLRDQATFQWEPVGSGRHGSRCVSVSSTNSNDARWVQRVTGLTPGAGYWLTGWIKGTNVVRDPGCSIGANFCLHGTWDHAPDLLDGSFDWQQFSFPFTAPENGSVEIGCRLGFWGNCARGKVWFDDVALVRPEGLRLEAPTVREPDRVEFSVIAQPFIPCRIDQSTDLRNWTEAERFTAAHPITEIALPLPASSACFYRAAMIGFDVVPGP